MAVWQKQEGKLLIQPDPDGVATLWRQDRTERKVIADKIFAWFRDPAGQRLVYLSFRQKGLRSVGPDGQDVIVLSPEPVYSAIAHDDGFIYYAVRRGLKRIHADGTGEEMIRPWPRACVVLSSRGDRLIFADDDGNHEIMTDGRDVENNNGD